MYGIKLSAFLCGCLVVGSTAAWADTTGSASALADTENAENEQATEAAGKTEATAEAATAEATAEATTDEAPEKPWRVGAVLSQDIGIGAFVSDEFARNVNYGYAVKVTGSYDIIDLLSVIARIDFDQRLYETRGTEGTETQEFFFREMRLGLSSTSFYEIPVVGVTLGANTTARLPTDKNALANGRYLGWTVAAGFTKVFEDLGPGNLTIQYASGYRLNFGQPTGDIPGDIQAGKLCRIIGDAAADCTNSVSNTNYSFSNGLTLEYAFLEDFSVALGLTVTNSIKYDLSQSNLDGFEHEVGRSPYATSGRNQSDLLWGSIEIGYGLTDNFSVALGALTVSNPFINKDGDQYALRNPFWDTDSSANNLTSIYFDVNFTY